MTYNEHTTMNGKVTKFFHDCVYTTISPAIATASGRYGKSVCLD